MSYTPEVEAQIRASEEHADEEWKRDAFQALTNVAYAQGEFISDHVWDELERMGTDSSTHNNSAMGPIMRAGARAGLAVKSDRHEPAYRPNGHGHALPVWYSRVVGLRQEDDIPEINTTDHDLEIETVLDTNENLYEVICLCGEWGNHYSDPDTILVDWHKHLIQSRAVKRYPVAPAPTMLRNYA